MRDEQSQRSAQQSSNSLDWLMLICTALGVTVNVFMHKHHGKRYIDIQGFYGLLLIILFSAFFPGANLGPMMAFLVAYLIACPVARIQNFFHRDDGDPGHSHYSGIPRLMRFFPDANEVTFKRLVEPLLLFLTGSLVLAIDQVLGSYLIVIAIALFISTNVREAFYDRKAEALNNSMIEQREIAERFRRLNRNQL